MADDGSSSSKRAMICDRWPIPAEVTDWLLAFAGMTGSTVEPELLGPSDSDGNGDVNRATVVIPVLVTGIHPTARVDAGREMDPGHKARDDQDGTTFDLNRECPSHRAPGSLIEAGDDLRPLTYPAKVADWIPASVFGPGGLSRSSAGAL